MRSRGKRYVAEVLLLAGLVMALVGAFDYVVDPYDMNRWVRVAGFNAEKPQRLGRDRLQLTVTIGRRQPRTLLMGSSRTARGLDETHPSLDGAMIGAFPGATIGEIERVFEHALVVAPVRRVVLGLDFFAFSAATPPSPSFDAARFRRYGQRPSLTQLLAGTPLDPTYFSFAMLRDSVATVTGQPQPAAAPALASAAAPAAPARDGAPAMRDKFRLAVKDGLTNPAMDGNFAFGTADPLASPGIAAFRRLLLLARQAGVELQLFISPTHASLLPVLERSGRLEDYGRWKRALVAVLAEDAAAHPGKPPVRLVDFSGGNAYTTEPVPEAGKMWGYTDPSHYTYALGNLILEVLAGRRPPGEGGFGVELTAASVEGKLAADRAALEAAKEPWLFQP